MRLTLDTDFCLRLAGTILFLYEAQFDLLFKTDKLGCSCLFGNGLFCLMFESLIVGNVILSGGLH